MFAPPHACHHSTLRKQAPNSFIVFFQANRRPPYIFKQTAFLLGRCLLKPLHRKHLSLPQPGSNRVGSQASSRTCRPADTAQSYKCNMETTRIFFSRSLKRLVTSSRNQKSTSLSPTSSSVLLPEPPKIAARACTEPVFCPHRLISSLTPLI